MSDLSHVLMFCVFVGKGMKLFQVPEAVTVCKGLHWRSFLPLPDAIGSGTLHKPAPAEQQDDEVLFCANLK